MSPYVVGQRFLDSLRLIWLGLEPPQT